MTKRHVSIAAAIIAVAGVAILLAQQSSQTPGAVTLTGCLRQGSAPAVFLLRAAADPAPETPSANSAVPAEDYLLVSVPARVDLSAHLNHKMEITGQKSESAPPPTGANAAERAMPRLAVSDGHEVAPNCSGDTVSSGGR